MNAITNNAKLAKAGKSAHKAALLKGATLKLEAMLNGQTVAPVDPVKAVFINRICAAIKEQEETASVCGQSIFETLKECAFTSPKLEQGSKKVKAIKAQFVAGLEKVMKKESAGQVSSKLVRVLVFLSHGFEFESTNYGQAYIEALGADVPYWQKKSAGDRSNGKKTGKTLEITKSITAMNDNALIELVQSVPHAIQIRLAIDTLNLLKVAIPKKLAAMVSEGVTA